MRNLIKAAFAVIIATMAFSCTKENQEVVVGNSKATIDVCIDGIIDGYSAQEETKVTAQTVIRILWQGDEAVYAYEGTKYLGKLTATKGDTEGTYAKLSGTITAPTAGKTVTLVCSPQYSDAPAVISPSPTQQSRLSEDPHPVRSFVQPASPQRTSAQSSQWHWQRRMPARPGLSPFTKAGWLRRLHLPTRALVSPSPI